MSRKIYLPTLGVWEDVDDATLLKDVPRVSSDGILINPVTAQPHLMPAINGNIEIAMVLAGESKTLPSDGVVGYRLIVHDAIATDAVTIADDDGTYAIPVGSIGLFEFQSSGDVTLDNSSNTGGPITVLEIA